MKVYKIYRKLTYSKEIYYILWKDIEQKKIEAIKECQWQKVFSSIDILKWKSDFGTFWQLRAILKI